MTRAAHPRAFTLIEVTVSLSVMALVMIALASVLTLLGRAIPTERESLADAHANAARAASALESLAGDLVVASTVRDLSPSPQRFTDAQGREAFRALTFTVPDRDGDAAPESLTVRWSAGAPVTMTINGGEARTVVENAQDFAVRWETQSETDPGEPGAPVEGAEQLLAAYNGATALEMAFTGGNQIQQVFTAWLPPDVISWRVTRVRLELRYSLLSLGTLRVELYRASSATRRATGSALASATLLETVLSATSAYTNVPLPSSASFVPGELAAILINPAVLGGSRARYSTTGIPDDYANIATTTSSGSSWTVVSDGSMNYEVWGRITRPAPAVARTVQRARRVVLSVTLGDGIARELSVALPGRPEYAP
ncbi:MAG: prepilin-type N-terminal cleavage/methylation domain-containing protein [Planctomycetota bacterium]|nr:prepilin-type N-terminal cleavage/methylation domain-containing protein [Planctomycetota bacterium]